MDDQCKQHSAVTVCLKHYLHFDSVGYWHVRCFIQKAKTLKFQYNDPESIISHVLLLNLTR